MKTQINTRPASVWRAALLTAAIISMLSFNRAQAQAPAVVGIDHVGINVPDMEQAIKFFHDMFGFTPVTKLGPFPMDKTWKTKFHIHDNADQVELVMMRAGDGSNIELFAYKPNVGSQEQPYRDDLSATHFSLYTSDILATKTYLESKGIKFVSDVNSGAGDTEGEKWVYFETPWGSTIELNSYPKGKGYEKNHPAVKLWTAASAVDLNTISPSKADLKKIADLQRLIWDNTDAKQRLSQLGELYADDVLFYDEEAVTTGLTELNDRITKLLAKNKGFKFSLIKIDNNNNVVRYFWNYGPKSNPKLIAGTDLMIIENGKVRSLHVFLDKLPK